MRSFEAVATVGILRSEAMAVRRTKITIETEGLLVVRQARTVMNWCPDCQAEVEVLLLGEDFSMAQLVGSLPARTLHIWRPPEGSTRICLPSLLRCSQSNDIQQIQIPERTPGGKGEGQ
jgi:hypothetical protein